jgi:hypothetical protein
MKDLKEITDKNPFGVPENYFEEFNSKIIASTAGRAPETRKKGLYRRLKPYLAVAASVAVLVLLSYTALKIFRPSENVDVIPFVSLQEVIDSYINDIDVLTLEEEFTAIASYDRVPEVSNAEIIDYLILENIDLDDIYEIL